MENCITPQRIANSIGLDSNFKGVYLLVEGIKDIKLFGKLLNDSDCKIKPTFGKYEMREVYEILTNRGFLNKVGIRDADFLRIKENDKFDPNYCHQIFPTDCHDLEGMIIIAEAFDDFIRTIVDSSHLADFQSKNGKLREVIYDLCYAIGCLRLANRRCDLGLSFKPKKPEGRKLKFKKFICEKTFTYLGDQKLINSVIEYSTNRGSKIQTPANIQKCLTKVWDEKHSPCEIVNGHDLTQVLFILLKKGLKCSSKTLQNSDCIEEMLALAYHFKHFEKTNLYAKILFWEKRNDKVLLKTA